MGLDRGSPSGSSVTNIPALRGSEWGFTTRVTPTCRGHLAVLPLMRLASDEIYDAVVLGTPPPTPVPNIPEILIDSRA